MSILQNAIDSIIIGVEDYNMDEQECQSCGYTASHECDCGEILSTWNIENDENLCDSCQHRWEKMGKE